MPPQRRGGRQPRGSARVVAVPPDKEAVARGLKQARGHLASARAAGVDEESRYLLLYQAALKAVSALLLSAGRRVTEGRGSHALRIREARKLLPSGMAELLDEIDLERRTRNRVAYEWGRVSGYELESADEATEELLDAVASVLGWGDSK